MDKILNIVQQLEQIRGVPQFIFIAPIKHTSIVRLRKEVRKFKKKNPDTKEIDFILESPGGSADHAYLLIKTLRDNFDTVNIIVPFWAKSAATLSALGGSTIIMDHHGQFGPLDVQLTRDEEVPDSEPQSGLIDEYSLKTIENRGIELYRQIMTRLLKKSDDPSDIDIRIKKTALSKQAFEYISALYSPLFQQIDPYKIGEKARSLAIAERYAERILKQYNEENIKETIEEFVGFLVHDCPDHGYNIDYSIMSVYLSNVKRSSEISEEYCETLTELSFILFSIPVQEIYVGFFDKKLLEKKKEIKDTKIEAVLPPQKTGKEKEGGNDEEKRSAKQTKRFIS